MKPSPKVTVVVPTFNRAMYLPRVIASVLNQTFQDFELVIVDDGSADDTRQVVQTYMDRQECRVRYVYQDHRNASVARNNGIKHALGKYIAFLDSDDVWLERKLEKQVTVLDQMDVALVHTNRKVVDSSFGRRSQLFPVPKIYALSSKHLLGGNSFIAMTVMVRASVLEKVGGFDETLGTTMDMELWLRIAREFEIAFLDEPLMVSHKLEDGLSYADLEQKYSDRIKVLEKMLAETHPFVDKAVWHKRLIDDSHALALEKSKK